MKLLKKMARATAMYSDGSYLARNPDWHQSDSPWKAQHIAQILRRNRIDARTICEIGCGAGGVLHSLHELLSEEISFFGYEVSPQAFEICRKKAKDRLSFRLADLLENDASEFDLVLAIDVIEHVEDCFGFLRKLRGKGKFKVLHIPLDLSVQSVLRSKPILKLRSSVGHIHYFTKETALALLQETGYQIVDYRYTGGALDLPNRGWKAALMKLPRRLFFSMHEDLAVRILGGFSLLVLAR